MFNSEKNIMMYMCSIGANTATYSRRFLEQDTQIVTNLRKAMFITESLAAIANLSVTTSSYLLSSKG